VRSSRRSVARPIAPCKQTCNRSQRSVAATIASCKHAITLPNFVVLRQAVLAISAVENLWHFVLTEKWTNVHQNRLRTNAKFHCARSNRVGLRKFLHHYFGAAWGPIFALMYASIISSKFLTTRLRDKQSSICDNTPCYWL